MELSEIERHFQLDLSPLQGMRNDVVKGLSAGSTDAQALMTAYRALCEVVVDRVPGNLRPGAQIALIIHMAVMRTEADDDEGYLEELRDARLYADNMDLQEVVAAIDDALASHRQV